MFNRKTLILAAAIAAVSFVAPARADQVGDKIASCVAQHAFIKVDGKDLHFRPNEDFRVVSDAYGRYGVQWKTYIQRQERWAPSVNVAKRCINEATGPLTARK